MKIIIIIIFYGSLLLILGLYGLLNNAGVFCPLLPAEFHSLKYYSDMFAINCLGQVDVVKSMLPLMRRSTGGARIVNMSAALARNAAVSVSPYAISKYGVEAFSDSIRYKYLMFESIILCVFG